MTLKQDISRLLLAQTHYHMYPSIPWNIFFETFFCIFYIPRNILLFTDKLVYTNERSLRGKSMETGTVDRWSENSCNLAIVFAIDLPRTWVVFETKVKARKPEKLARPEETCASSSCKRDYVLSDHGLTSLCREYSRECYIFSIIFSRGSCNKQRGNLSNARAENRDEIPIKGQGRMLAVTRKLRSRRSSGKRWKSLITNIKWCRIRTLRSIIDTIIEKFEDGSFIN